MSVFSKLDQLYIEANNEFNEGTYETFEKTEIKFRKKLISKYGFTQQTAKDFVQGFENEDNSTSKEIFIDSVLLGIKTKLEDSDIIKEFDKIGNLIETFNNLGENLLEIEQEYKKRLKEHIEKNIFNPYKKWLMLNYSDETIILEDTEYLTLTLRKTYKSFNWLLFIFFSLFYLVPGVIYAIITLQSKTITTELQFNDEGKIMKISNSHKYLMDKFNNNN